jgi:hypothetical protein
LHLLDGVIGVGSRHPIAYPGHDLIGGAGTVDPLDDCRECLAAQQGGLVPTENDEPVPVERPQHYPGVDGPPRLGIRGDGCRCGDVET